MQEIRGDIWKHMTGNNRLVIPTNGFTRSDGLAVMGRGLAQQCAVRFPVMPRLLGDQINLHGNHVWEFNLQYNPTHPIAANLITFPVKHNWWEKADLKLIDRSARELMQFMVGKQCNVYIPRVGCGNGGLTWEVVYPVLEVMLSDERFIVVTQ